MTGWRDRGRGIGFMRKCLKARKEFLRIIGWVFGICRTRLITVVSVAVLCLVE